MDTDSTRKNVIMLPLEYIDQFKNHSYTVKKDDELLELMDSIHRNGVQEPILVRPKKDDRFEILSGHRRTLAAKMDGFSEIPAIVIECNDDEAALLVCETNLHRTTDYQSECRAVKLQLQALNHQGQRGYGKNSARILAEQMHISEEEVRRMAHRALLQDPFFEAVEAEKLGKTAAFHLSYLTDTQQEQLLQMIFNGMCVWEEISVAATQIKKLASTQEKLTIEAIMSLLHKEEFKPTPRYRGEIIEFELASIALAANKNSIEPKEARDLVFKALQAYTQAK